MSSPEVEIETGPVGGPRRPSSVRSTVMVLAVPLVVVGIAAVAVLGGRPDPATGPRTNASPSAPKAATTPAPTPRSVPDLAIPVPRGQVPLDFTHRPLAGVEPGLTGTARAELARGHAYTLLVRCAGAGEIRWPETQGATTASGALPCDGAVHSADLATISVDARSAAIDFSFDLAADTHIVVVETPRLASGPDVVAVPLAPDGSRPAVLGASTDAITVEAILEDDVYTGLAVRRLSLDGTVVTLAFVPASAFPSDARPTLYNGSATVSRNGFLAVPFETEDGSEEVAVFDLTDPLSEAAVVGDRATGFGWGPDGQLAVGRAGGIGVYDPITRRVDAVTIAPDLDLGDRFTWTTDARFAATRTNGDSSDLGEIRGDGTFLPGERPLFDPLGVERPRSADGRTLGEACDDGPTGGGCFVIVSDANGRVLGPWTGSLDIHAAPTGYWGSDGQSVWLFARDGKGRARLVHSGTPTTGRIVARFALRNLADESTQIVGASADDAAVAIGIESREVVVVDTRSGATHRIAGSFAGWADTRGSVYPLPPAR